MFLIIFGLNLNSAYGNIYTEYNNNILETESVIQIRNGIPESCYVIAEFPVVLTSISDIKGLRTEDVLKNPKIISRFVDQGKCIYYFYDGYCIKDTISPTQGSKLRCKRMLEVFDYKQVWEIEHGNSNFFLYKIVGGGVEIPNS
jgi:hypothetical protein